MSAQKLVLALALSALGCREPSEPGRADASSSAVSSPGQASSAAPPGAAATATSALPFARAELRREAAAVSEEDLTAQSSERRALAVRTLARIQDETSFEPLAKALADEDTRVVSWAAFGVGQLCRGREPEAVRRLAIRAASLVAEPPTGSEEALGSIALSLGRCASEPAERALRGWLRQNAALAVPAALALGRVARERKRLDDATIAALLDGAQQRPDEEAYFFALESLPSLGPAARERLLEVATEALERPGKARAAAARALAKAGGAAARPLRRLLEDERSSVVERAGAAGALGALGSAARTELIAALDVRARSLIDRNAWLTGHYGVVLSLLDGLEPPLAEVGLLPELSRLPLEGEPPPIARRKIMLRCRAAAALAGSKSLSGPLLACDPTPGDTPREGSLALLRVLGRGSLAGGRGARFLELTRASDRVVREAALELLMSHDEVPTASALLASALAATEPGVRATAAKVLARYPARAQETADGPPDPRVIQALTSRLGQGDQGQSVEVTALMLDAATSLELLGVKPALERACASTNPTLRLSAERGFAALGERGRRCPNRTDGVALASLPVGSVRLELDTDVGPLVLTLSSDTSPFAVQRLVELARAGFYDGMPIHRSVPGFVVQAGDPDGDGFGGPDLPPLRCQVSLEPFEAGSVGIALAGRDTGLSQFFVTLRRAPHLDGEYSLLGRAEPGWERVMPGDRIQKVRVLEGGGK